METMNEIMKLKNGFEIEIEESNTIFDLSTLIKTLDEAEKIKKELSNVENLEKVIFKKGETETAYEFLELSKFEILIDDKRQIKFAFSFRDKNEIEKANFKNEQDVQNKAIEELALLISKLMG